MSAFGIVLKMDAFFSLFIQLKCAFLRMLTINSILSTYLTATSSVACLDIQHCDMIKREFNHSCFSCAVVSLLLWSLYQQQHPSHNVRYHLDGTRTHTQLQLQKHTCTHSAARNLRKLHQINRKLESSVTFPFIGPQIVLSDINFNIIGLSI